MDSFIHKDHVKREDVRYIKKTLDMKMSHEHFGELVDHIRKAGCIPTATPFDEDSVDFAEQLDLPILKIASSDLNDWVLIEKITKTKNPVIVEAERNSLDLVGRRQGNLPLTRFGDFSYAWRCWGSRAVWTGSLHSALACQTPIEYATK